MVPVLGADRRRYHGAHEGAWRCGTSAAVSWTQRPGLSPRGCAYSAPVLSVVLVVLVPLTTDTTDTTRTAIKHLVTLSRVGCVVVRSLPRDRHDWTGAPALIARPSLTDTVWRDCPSSDSRVEVPASVRSSTSPPPTSTAPLGGGLGGCRAGLGHHGERSRATRAGLSLLLTAGGRWCGTAVQTRGTVPAATSRTAWRGMSWHCRLSHHYSRPRTSARCFESRWPRSRGGDTWGRVLHSSESAEGFDISRRPSKSGCPRTSAS
jgi:hypothetical protein